MVPRTLIGQLAIAADTAINTALARGAVVIGQPPPTAEVGYVAAVVIRGIADLAAAWRPILQPIGLSVRLHGVFCHQAPQVSFTDQAGQQRKCELADLLVVVEDHVTGSNRRWATLVQAKVAAAGGGKHLSQPGDLVQHELLSTWPLFTMPAGYAPHGRDVASCAHPGLPTDCGRYGLIDPGHFPAWYQQAPSLNLVSSGTELGAFIAHMVETGQTRYGREATGAGDDWSFTVEELLARTASLMFTHQASFPGSQPRGATAIAFAASDPFLHAFMVVNGDVGGGPPAATPDDEPDPGISVLRVQIEAAG